MLCICTTFCKGYSACLLCIDQLLNVLPALSVSMYHVDNLPVQVAFCFLKVASLLHGRKLLESKVRIAKLRVLATISIDHNNKLRPH